MTVGIYTNLHKDGDLSVTTALLNELRARKVDYVLDPALKGKVKGSFFDLEKSPDCDVMITVGGDGTILRIAKYCAVYGVPIAGLNLGYVGFLAEEDPENIREFVDKIIKGDYKLESRSLLNADVNGQSFLALNEVILTREITSRMIETDVFVNDEFVDRFFCDGFIISTPTGSTAYSLSAGGAILSPTVSAFILTSINSHSLHSRPIVVSEKDEITLTATCDASLVIDGNVDAEVKKGEMVKVRKYDKEVSFVRFRGHSFYEKLLTKLNKWSFTDGRNKLNND
ncbi:MAG: NAD(+)/NADH kinase [Clostridia bacterium]|nr:NAD(+)/NADH kinase [Clostridia bacterium]